MSDKSEEKNDKNNIEKSEVKEDKIEDIDSKLDDEEEEEDENKNINFEKVGEVKETNIPEKKEEKEEQKKENVQEDKITTTKYTTTKFTTTKVKKTPNINFVQSSANLHCKFEDLNKLGEKLSENAEIEKRGKKEEQIEKKKYFDRIKLLIEKPKKFAFIYKSGKIVCFGAKNVEESKNVCKKCANIIENCGYKVELKENDIKINNISGNFDLNFKINIKKYYQKLIELSKSKDINISKISGESKSNSKINGKKCQELVECSKFYNETNSFSGVNLYNEKSKFFIRAFSSGKTTFGGAKNKDQIEEEYKKLYPLLYQSKK